MIEFNIIKKSSQSKARLGIIQTQHGTIETPSLVAVATQATIKTLTQEQVKDTNTQVAIANTYHLHIRPGEGIINQSGGLHRFMNWQKPLMTDSGGFQVFSFGFGKDLGIGKILNSQTSEIIKVGQQPRLIKMSDDGVWFTSYLDGKKLFLNPKKSIEIQQKLGADIIFAFDECPPPNADYQYIQKSLTRTHAWAKKSLIARTSQQAIFGIIQGGKFKDLRLKSTNEICKLNFDGFGIGGEMGVNKKEMIKMLNWVTAQLPDDKPRHLLGNGSIKDIVDIIKSGIDLFDCVIPTHYARHGSVFTSQGIIELTKTKYLDDLSPLDPKCHCNTCLNYRKNYLCHLIKAGEVTAMSLLTIHNLFYYNNYLKLIRERIKNNLL